MEKFKKPLLIITVASLIVMVITVLFFSPITKYLVEKYDKKFTGRQITIESAYANIFTGFVNFSKVRAYELNSDSVFLSADAVKLNFSMLKMLSNTFEISELTIDRPIGKIIQKKKIFNYYDLIETFSSNGKPDTTSNKRSKVRVINLKINNAEFHFQEKEIPINYFIKKANFVSHRKGDSETFITKFSFVSGSGSGDVKGDFTVNLKNYNYSIATVVNQFDLEIFEQYLKDLMNYGNISAKLDGDIVATGNFNNEENITIKGMVAISDFHLGKSLKEDYVSFDKLALVINKMSPRNHQYSFDSVQLIRPSLTYEMYDNLDNLQTMFGSKVSNISNAENGNFNLVLEIARYAKVLAKNFFRSPYEINHLRIEKANLEFSDYARSEKFNINLAPLYISADSIKKNIKNVKVFLKSDIKPFGKVNVTLSINPKDSSDFDMQYQVQKIPASIFNPYTISYTSFSLDRGTLELNGKWHVRNGIIQSNNHLLVIDPRLSERLPNKDRKRIPLPLIMAFVRERGNVIDYEIPIKGDLNNPKFRLKDVILDLLKNIFIKPPTTPYAIKVKNAETEIENALTLTWALKQSTLEADQQKFTEKIADFLKKNKAAFIEIYPQQYEVKEKEYILLFEAKKKYFLAINKRSPQSFTKADYEKIDKMSAKDVSFVAYLNKFVNDKTVFTIQEKCARFVGQVLINTKFKELNAQRLSEFKSYFKEKDLEKRIKIFPSKNVIPFNGFSFYKIIYKGDFPASLMKAYFKMDEFNKEKPRKRFKRERKEIQEKTLLKSN